MGGKNKRNIKFIEIDQLFKKFTCCAPPVNESRIIFKIHLSIFTAPKMKDWLEFNI